MREIKFRAWNGKKMIYRGLHDKNWYYTPKNDENGCHWAFPADQSDALFKIMEYTGLKDKNGKEIYEGDIINIGDKDEICSIEKTFIEYEGGSFIIKYLGFKYSLWNFDSNDIEIVGNIYENPELLEGAKNERD